MSLFIKCSVWERETSLYIWFWSVLRNHTEQNESLIRLAAIDGVRGYTGVKSQHRYVTCLPWHRLSPLFWLLFFFIYFFLFKYLKGKRKGEREVVCGQVWWPILGICPLHLTHPSAHSQQWTHTRSSGQPYCGARGAVGGSVPCSRVSPQSWYWRWREHLLFTPPTDNPCRTWGIEPATFGLQLQLSNH